MDPHPGLAYLADNPWLSKLPDKARSQLLCAATIQHYSANQAVHKKNESANALYGVVSGEVRISATTYAGDEIVFTRIAQGHWFGEIALLDGGKRTHDAHAYTDTALAVLPKEAVVQLCQQSPAFYQALVLLLCNHCRQAFSAVDDFLVFSPEQRLAKRLLMHLPSNGESLIHLSQQELGALVGISRQSTNKILKSWETQGWIKRVYRGLDIVEKTALQNLLKPQ